MGSSVDRETIRPFLWNSSRGFLAYSRNKLLLLRGDMAMGIWVRKYRYCSTGLWWGVDRYYSFIVHLNSYHGHIQLLNEASKPPFNPVKRTDLLEVEAMRDVVSSHEGSQQMGDGTSLTTVRPEHECVHPPLSERKKTNKYYTEKACKYMFCYSPYSIFLLQLCYFHISSVLHTGCVYFRGKMRF